MLSDIRPEADYWIERVDQHFRTDWQARSIFVAKPRFRAAQAKDLTQCPRCKHGLTRRCRCVVDNAFVAGRSSCSTVVQTADEERVNGTFSF
jgi:hypothetical protein